MGFDTGKDCAGEAVEKIIIRENNVLAVETRSGLFVIAQALKHHTLVFFKLFTTTPLSFNADLNHAEYLCCVTPVKSFFKRANILKLKIPPASDMEHYSRQNHLALDLTDYRLETFIAYAGTKDEIMIPHIPVGGFRLVDWKLQTLQHLSKEKDIDIINEYQFDTMGVYGELCERLYLSYRYGRYVEPLKDLRLGNVPKEYKVYFQIVAGQISEEEWKKLPLK